MADKIIKTKFESDNFSAEIVEETGSVLIRDKKRPILGGVLNVSLENLQETVDLLVEIISVLEEPHENHESGQE